MRFEQYSTDNKLTQEPPKDTLQREPNEYMQKAPCQKRALLTCRVYTCNRAAFDAGKRHMW